jgi:CRP-like cAMP-binding protein
VPLLQHLSEFQIEALSKELTRQQFAAGQAIVTQGEEGDEMYFLDMGDALAEVDGKVRKSTYHPISCKSSHEFCQQ